MHEVLDSVLLVHVVRIDHRREVYRRAALIATKK